MFSNLPNSKPPCGHSGSPLVVEGVQLKCCDSSAKTCKIKEMSRLLRENMNLSEKVVELERKVAELEKKTEVAQNKPTTVNNYIYVESYNVNAILNDDVAVELIQAGLKGKDIFNGFYEICQKSNN
ncbi:MAG TPA: hypothetical protein PKD85_11390, partial [Saprospiraceae bacterium]|nr:hypothetical protein [Saprospiraceae bacterium]